MIDAPLAVFVNPSVVRREADGAFGHKAVESLFIRVRPDARAGCVAVFTYGRFPKLIEAVMRRRVLQDCCFYVGGPHVTSVAHDAPAHESSCQKRQK